MAIVDDDGDVVAVGTKLLQQHVQPLRLRNEHRRSEHAADVRVLLGVMSQQVLCQQDADHGIAIAVDHRKA